MGKDISGHMSDKGLISKMHKKLIHLNSKNKQSNFKKRKGPEQMFKKRYTVGQYVYEKVPSISNYQGNANQNHSVIPHISWMTIIKKKITNVFKDVE